MEIYLIRHLKTEALEKGVVQGTESDVVVNEASLKRIEEIKKEVGDVDKVYSSPLKRTKETVERIFPDKEILYDPLLVEYVVSSDLVGLTTDQYKEYWDVTHKKDKYDPLWKDSDGESYFECAVRAERFHRKLDRDANDGVKSVAVVGHGTFFRHLMCALTNTPWMNNPRVVIDLVRKIPIDNLSVYKFEI